MPKGRYSRAHGLDAASPEDETCTRGIGPDGTRLLSRCGRENTRLDWRPDKYWRDDDRGVFFGVISTSQIISLPLVAIGLGLIYWTRREARRAAAA